MTTPDLIDYIESQTKKNIPKEIISSKLALAGWYKTDIEEGFAKVMPPVFAPQPVLPVVQPTPIPSLSSVIPPVVPIVAPVMPPPPAPITMSIPKPAPVVENPPIQRDDNIAKIAMMSSYAKDSMSTGTVSEMQKSGSKKHSLIVSFVIIIAVVGIIVASFLLWGAAYIHI